MYYELRACLLYQVLHCWILACVFVCLFVVYVYVCVYAYMLFVFISLFFSPLLYIRLYATRVLLLFSHFSFFFFSLFYIFNSHWRAFRQARARTRVDPQNSRSLYSICKNIQVKL